MTAQPDTREAPDHPIRRGVLVASHALADISALPTAYLGVEDKAEVLLELVALEAQVKALKLGVLAEAGDVAERVGARDAGAWLAHHARTDAGPQRRELRIAEALRDRWPRVRDALGAGSLNPAQAEVIVAALDALDLPNLPSGVVQQAEEHLLALAHDFAPRQLRILGRRILDLVAPEIGEQHEARALEREEQRAAERTELSFQAFGNGCTRITAVVPDATAHRLRTYLDSFTSPRRDGSHQRPGHEPGEADRIPAYRRRGQAFCSLLETIDPARLPRHGGDATTVFVSVTLDALRSELATAGLIEAGDDRITASEARRLACNAAIVPVVLGTRSEVLDLGRTARLFSPGQRKALRVRDRRCRTEGCTIPAAWCEAHHLDPWSTGGRTDLDRGVLLCSHHHHRAHDHRYRTVTRADGEIEFHRRT